VDDGGDETISALEATHGKLPDTVTAVTGSGGRHYVFKYPQGRSIPNKTKFAPGLDTRSTGGLIVAAPSIHVSGNRYEWIKDHSPFDRTPAEAPEWLLKLMEREEVLLTPFEGSSIIVEIKEGNRNSTPDKPCRNHESKRNDGGRHLYGITCRKQRKVQSSA